MVQISINGINREMTAVEQAEYNQIQADFEATKVQEKLNSIKLLRNEKLKETDFYALSDVTMSDAMTTYRQALRNIPQDYTTEDEYDLLLARDEQGNLTHSVWSKP